MKNILKIVLISCILSSCSSEKNDANAQTGYKGGQLYNQPPISVFPTDGMYSKSTLSDEKLTNALDQKVKQIVSSQNIIGLTTTALIPNKGIWQFNTGYISKKNNLSVDANTVFYWASVGKLITSIIIHQLIEDKKISLDDTLQKWYPQFQDADKITISQLLNHTSGIYSFNSDTAFHYSNQYHSPDELLAIALKNKNLFKPGEYWSYSNTGLLLLALIAEKIETTNFSEIVKNKLSTPYQLNSLKSLRPKETPSNLALTHKDGIDFETNFSTPLGAGNIVSDSKDMAVLLSLLLTGKILPIQTVHKMFSKLYPTFDKGLYYGHGVMLYNFKEINNISNQWIGHSGGTENYKAILVYDFKTQAIIAVSINSNVSAEAVANNLLGSL